MVMTSIDKFRSEIYIVVKLFENGLETLHLKKPKFSKSQYKDYINQIPKKFHSKIIIHKHFNLVYKYKLKGFNLSKKNKPSRWFIWITKILKKRLIHTTTCHSLAHLKNTNNKNYDYILVGPLYKNSSKLKTANSKFNEGKIKEIIFSYAKKVVFYGGVSDENLNSLNNNHLHGLIIQGSIWYNNTQQPLDVYLDYCRKLHNKSSYGNKNN